MGPATPRLRRACTCAGHSELVVLFLQLGNHSLMPLDFHMGKKGRPEGMKEVQSPLLGNTAPLH